MQRVHVDECLPCLLKEVSRLECQAAKTKRAEQGYKDHVAILGAHAGREVPTRISHTLVMTTDGWL